MADKVTEMRLKVDLQCPCCCKKVKKILCKFPQIKDQVYDEKHNLVTITVVCCSPEKIRDKLCYKGGKVIKSIEIVEQQKPKQPDKPKEPGKPKEPEHARVAVFGEPKEREKPKGIVLEKPKAPAPLPPAPAAPVPPEPCLHQEVPVGFYCVPCSEGYNGGPCYYAYRQPVPSPPCYDSYGYGYGKGCPYSRCDYFSEENTGSCAIM